MYTIIPVVYKPFYSMCRYIKFEYFIKSTDTSNHHAAEVNHHAAEDNHHAAEDNRHAVDDHNPVDNHHAVDDHHAAG